ncbi:BLUF domain-containing protein [Croceicoccus marinus]|jgi:hypothetical protein|uniref:BLUF domain-containing protein n=1 Tax=Croceicoccus marinus TaxID=450378 RepID=A0A7G6W0G8_9SPHN|nr:BLUF domain-containing protein [Croceicoccus marinus]QNE07483.1 BLUF domain-containing protein [Croceicoccus marinus]
MPLCKLLYTSRSAETSPRRTDQIAQIARQSALRNAKAGITGSLVYVEDSFIQVLEGPQAEVERVFESICCDFRHREIKLIDLVPVPTRQFAEWHMGFLASSEDDPLYKELEQVRYLVSVNARTAAEHIRNLMGR